MTDPSDFDAEQGRGSAEQEPDWRIFHGDGVSRNVRIPDGPPWRQFDGASPAAAGDGTTPYIIDQAAIDVVNAALYLRRPLLVTGYPGTGKSSLARAIANELKLGDVLSWPINSRSTLQEALYRYDAIGRLQDANLQNQRGEAPSDIGTFVRLGPLGTALAPSPRPRVLLVDELDKGDIDLPNDLLAVFEDGSFEIPELSRLPKDPEGVQVLTADPHAKCRVRDGIVRCTQFPIVVITNNGERDFPPAFRRRCLPLHLDDPDEGRLRDVIAGHLGEAALARADDLVKAFVRRRQLGELATDQLLNAVYLRVGGAHLEDPEGLLKTVLHRLNPGG